jgi:hypothetical protein
VKCRSFKSSFYLLGKQGKPSILKKENNFFSHLGETGPRHRTKSGPVTEPSRHRHRAQTAKPDPVIERNRAPLHGRPQR